MLMALLLLGSDPTAAVTLRDVFVDGCVAGRGHAAVIEKNDDLIVEALQRDTAAAKAVRVFRVGGVSGAQFTFAEFTNRPDGLTFQCGVSAPQWSLGDAVTAIFNKLGFPPLDHTPVVRRANDKYFWRHAAGNQDSASRDTQIVYGQLNGATFLVLRRYDKNGASRRAKAAQFLTSCFDSTPRQMAQEMSECSTKTIKEARNTVLGSYVSP